MAFPKGSLGQCQFYYMDKFILLSAGNALKLYKYALDLTVNDLKRYQRRSRYRVVASLAHTAQSVTAFAASDNSVPPPLTLSSTSGGFFRYTHERTH